MDGVRSLIILDKEGRVITIEGVDVIKKYGVEGYTFTDERLNELRAKEDLLKVAQIGAFSTIHLCPQQCSTASLE